MTSPALVRAAPRISSFRRPSHGLTRSAGLGCRDVLDCFTFKVCGKRAKILHYKGPQNQEVSQMLGLVTKSGSAVFVFHGRVLSWFYRCLNPNP